MATLYIDFTEPTPAPSQYKVRYKKTTDSTWIETTIPSPPPFSITGTTASLEYDVEVYSDCGGSVLSSPDTYIAEANDCQEFTFDNTSGVSLQSLTYYPCGDPSGDTAGLNLSVGSTSTECVNNADGIAEGRSNGIIIIPVSGFVLIPGGPCTA